MVMFTNFVLVLIAGVIAEVSCGAVEPNASPAVSERELFGNRRVVVKFTCPAIYGRYPHPLSCEYFFLCRFGYPTLMHCNRGYLYDESREQCRDKRRVHCRKGDHKDHKDKIPEEKEEVKDFKCPYIWGTFAHPTDCSKYFVCLYNLPTLFQCQGSELFHDKARRCLHRKKVDCGRRRDRDGMKTSRSPLTSTTKAVVTTTTIPTTTEGHNKFFCPFPSGRFADREDCSQYYDCDSSRPSLRQCPKYTLYDERQEECREERLVKCGDRPGGVGEDFKDKKENIYCPYVWGSFPHPTDCSKYILCIYNYPTVFTCRKDQLFHSYFRVCLPKKQVSCDNRINPDDLFPPGKSTSVSTFPITTTLELTTTTTTPEPTTTTTTPEPTTTTTTPELTTITPEPTTTTTTTPEPTTTTPEPTTTTTTTPEPTTTTTTTPEPTTTTTTPEPTTTTPEPTTTTTTLKPTTILKPTTKTTTPEPTTTTPKPTTTTTPEPTTTVTPKTTTRPTTKITLKPTTVSPFPVTKPNTPPPTDCDEDDLDCLVDETGDVIAWFDCPKRYGHFPHGSSKQLFIHCDNFRPFIKKCAENTQFSPEFHVCVWADKRKRI